MLPEPFQEYSGTLAQYLQNAREHLAKGEAQKASEMLWGAAAQMAKAIASLQGLDLSSHRDIRRYVTNLARESSDPRLLELFDSVERLHRNFYDFDIEMSEMELYLRRTEDFLGKMQSIGRAYLEMRQRSQKSIGKG